MDPEIIATNAMPPPCGEGEAPDLAKLGRLGASGGGLVLLPHSPHPAHPADGWLSHPSHRGEG